MELSIEETANRLKLIDTVFTRLPDRRGSGEEWDRLVLVYGIRGVRVHDAQLVAEMVVHGISHLLTLDEGDFARYEEITVVHPRDVR